MIKKKKGGQPKPYKTKVVGKRTPVKIAAKIKKIIDTACDPIINEYKQNLLKSND